MILFNSLITEGPNKVLQPIQRKIQRTETYIGDEEYQKELA